MARQQYPLEALRKLRDERAEAQAEALARQIARATVAAAALAERERLRCEHDRRTADVLRAEGQRLACGQLSGADLQRQIEFQAASRARAGALELAEGQAREALGRERGKEHERREELSRLEAEAELARSHEARFYEKSAGVELGAEEEAALEQWNARRR